VSHVCRYTDKERTMTTCPHCGGVLFLDPEESLLRCLLCAREYEQKRRELVPFSRSAPPSLKPVRRSA
jgi:DNA-directed RNA polymerase subunit M/transcription elongation factor TFIIS